MTDSRVNPDVLKSMITKELVHFLLLNGPVPDSIRISVRYGESIATLLIEDEIIKKYIDTTESEVPGGS